MKVTSRRDRLGVVSLVAVSLLFCVALALLGPVPQPEQYSSFADQRTILGVPNFWNVVSNLAFVAAGGWGLALLLGRRSLPGLLPPLRPAWLLFLGSSTLVGVGSAYYHLSPTDATLAWDRLPMTVGFMSFLAVVLGERVSPHLARRLLPALLVVGTASVPVWWLGGDLRLYILVQYLPMLLIPLAMLLFRSPFESDVWMWAGLVTYGLAKVLDVTDTPVYRLLGTIGGHPFKHLVAGAAIALLALALLRRRPALRRRTDAPSRSE
ncbi:MAG: alkaline phytoceramidase [Thermoanaerobaculaceae bacterium]